MAYTVYFIAVLYGIFLTYIYNAIYRIPNTMIDVIIQSVRSRVHGRRREGGWCYLQARSKRGQADHACVRGSANCTHKSNLTNPETQQGAIYLPPKGVGSQALQKMPHPFLPLLDPASWLVGFSVVGAALTSSGTIASSDQHRFIRLVNENEL